MDAPWYIYVLTVLAGVLTGYVNTLAGCGSAFSLAALGALGLPIDIANGTNRVAILLQNVVGTTGFHRQGKMDWKTGLKLAVPACMGAVLGAFLATRMDAHHLKRAVGVAMLLVLGLLFIKPQRWTDGMRDSSKGLHWIPKAGIFFCVGVYGGFIQMGVGVFLLTGLVFGAGYDVVRGNAVKVLIVLCFTTIALAVFIYSGKVYWSIGLLLACGSMAGAWIATRQAAKRGARFIRWLLIFVVSYAALKYLGVFDLVALWWKSG
jgi:hypothetical protein